MGEVLGLGISHYPPLSGRDDDMARLLKTRLQDPDAPAAAKDPAGWPELMRREWGEDEGAAGAAIHRQDMVRGLRKAREALDAFQPDLVLVWGDDQYENFRESLVPAFCVLAYEDMAIRPWAPPSEDANFVFTPEGGGRPNHWGEGRDFEIKVRGHREAARHIASALIERDFDVAYAYEPLNQPGLSHAFLNTVLYLDYDRRGFPFPIVPFPINCYGRLTISYRGFASRLGERGRPADPPSPSPRRIFDLGAETARVCRESPWRVALVASSSWSHAFLVDKTWRLQPDLAADRRMYRALLDGDWNAWRSTTLAEVEDAGQQELLNWFALAGAMDALGQACSWSDYVETYAFNSTKVTAIFPPAGAAAAS